MGHQRNAVTLLLNCLFHYLEKLEITIMKVETSVLKANVYIVLVNNKIK